MDALQAKVTSKGQITLPKRIRERLSIQSGDSLEFYVDEAKAVTMTKLQEPGSSAGCARAFLKPGHSKPNRKPDAMCWNRCWRMRPLLLKAPPSSAVHSASTGEGRQTNLSVLLLPSGEEASSAP